MEFYNAPAPNPMVVRLFILERGGIKLDIEPVDTMALENRKPAYRTQVNARGELPALGLDNGSIITEITAICEYLDEVTITGESLYGKTAEEHAETRMWLRRADLEIAQPVIAWWRNDPSTIDFYKGNRIPSPEAKTVQKVVINQALNQLDDDLEGKTWLCGDRFSAADIHFYGLMAAMVAWLNGWSRRRGRMLLRTLIECQNDQL